MKINIYSNEDDYDVYHFIEVINTKKGRKLHLKNKKYPKPESFVEFHKVSSNNVFVKTNYCKTKVYAYRISMSKYKDLIKRLKGPNATKSQYLLKFLMEYKVYSYSIDFLKKAEEVLNRCIQDRINSRWEFMD